MRYSANSVWENKDKYDVVVIGAGHAGCEAALATARLGFQTLVFTVSVDSIAMMPCNPNIGGSSKGHLVRELDALGGEMGKVIDRTFIQSKMLNKSKGPAVHSLRAQADKAVYSRTMRRVLEAQENLEIKHMWIRSAFLTGLVGRMCVSFWWKMERSPECRHFRVQRITVRRLSSAAELI